MFYPYCVYTKINHIGLYQLKDGRFQMIMQGNLSQLMTGFRYVIVEKTLAEFFKELEIESIDYKDAIIWNRGLNIEYDNYSQLFIHNQFSAEQIGELDLSGSKVFVLNSMGNLYVFVTPQLKEILTKKSGFKYLKFSEGLEQFAT